jgi:glycerol uptake facilitator protein
MEKNLRGYLAEMIGSFAVVFLSAGAVCANQLAIVTGNESLAPGLLGIAVATGLAYGVALAVTLPFSTGYLNPAITLMFWVFKRLDGAKTAALIFVQMLGAAAAGGLIRLIYTDEVLTLARMGAPHLNLKGFGLYPDLQTTGTSAWILLKGVALEAGLTFILAVVIFGTMYDPRVLRAIGNSGKRLVGLWVGLVLVVLTLAAFPLTGAAANPARWFGTVMWEMTIDSLRGMQPWRDHMVYWFGPIAGALLGGVVYNSLILPQESETPTATSVSTGPKAAASATLFRAKK